MDLVEFLKDGKVKFQLRHHPACFTAQEVAAAEHITGEEVAKVVIVKADDRFVMCVLRATYRLEMPMVAKAAGAKKVRLATEEEMARLCPDCEVGAMPPFGRQYNMDTYVDADLAADEEVLIPAGTHQDSVLLAWADYARLAEPAIAPLGVHLT